MYQNHNSGDEVTESFAVHGWEELSHIDPWRTMAWGYTQHKPYAVKLYARLGLHPILLHGILDNGACTCGRGDCTRSRGKHPVDFDWQSAPLNVERLVSTLERWPYHNIGIRTGMQPCGRALVVVDIDGPRALLEPLERKHGVFPPTLTARTGSGGLHLYYWLRDGVEIRNTQGIVPHVDIRGFGGQVVAAPSLHLSGRRYEWIDAGEPEVLP